MKAVASLVFGIVCAVGAGIVGISAASAVMSNPEGQHLTTLSEPDLWTSEPVRIDVQSNNMSGSSPSIRATSPITLVPGLRRRPRSNAAWRRIVYRKRWPQLQLIATGACNDIAHTMRPKIHIEASAAKYGPAYRPSHRHLRSLRVQTRIGPQQT